MKIFLVLHSEPVDDIEDCYGGMADFVLCDTGRFGWEQPIPHFPSKPRPLKLRHVV
jgi:hypothetical protein